MEENLQVVLEGRDILVKVPYSDGAIYFSFSEISRAHQSFTAMVQVFLNSTNEGVSESYCQRLDINSHSAVEGFRRSLQNCFEEKIKWVLVINRAFNAVVQKFNDAQIALNFNNQECEDSAFLLYPFLQKETNNMVFGDSEVGKSYYCLRLAASLASGNTFMGFTVPEFPKKTLFLDYEDSATVFNKRLFEIAAGMGVSKETLAEHIWWYKPEGSVRDLTEVIARMVVKGHFDLIVIDAGSNGAGGSPNDEQKVVDFFNALENIPCTKLIIHHEPKTLLTQAADKAYYGSVFWRALTRVAWRLTLENEENGKLIKATIAKKSNMGKVDPFYYRQQWEIGEIGANFGPVTLTREDILENLTSDSIIVNCLKEHGTLSRSQIVEITGVNVEVFKKAAMRLKDKGIINIRGEKKGAVWFLNEDTIKTYGNDRSP